MNKSLRASSIALALAVCTVSGVALAGAKSPASVVIAPAGPGTYAYASGNISTAAASADTGEYIGCEITAEMGNPLPVDSVEVVCYARNSAGTYMSCTTTHSVAIAVVGSINLQSNIKFSWFGNGPACQEITVSNGSQF
jgi:hypothetical protein